MVFMFSDLFLKKMPTQERMSIFMKTLACISLLSVSLIGCGAFAQDQTPPKDLKKMIHTWQEQEKTAQADALVRLETGSYDGNDFRSVIDTELAKIQEDGHGLNTLVYRTLNDNVRPMIFDTLFASETAPKFCQSIPSVPMKIKDKDKELTKEQLLEKQKAFDYSRCKKAFKDVLSGVMHADPKSFILSVEQEGEGSSHTSLWVFSMVEKDAYLKIDLSI